MYNLSHKNIIIIGNGMGIEKIEREEKKENGP